MDFKDSLMKILDFFLIIIYRFARVKIRRSKDDALDSAILCLSAYTAFFILSIICLVGLIKDNILSRYFIEKGVISFSILLILLPIIFYTLYSNVDIERIEKKYLEEQSKKNKIYRDICCCLLLITPFITFIFFRLYKYGHI